MSVPTRLRPIPLWKEEWNADKLRRRQSEGERSFNRGFRLLAASDKDYTFPHYAACRMHGVALGTIQRSNWPKFTGLDPASSKRPGTAIVTVAVNPQDYRRYPIDVRVGQWRSTETAEVLSDINQQYNPTVIMVEDNATQTAIVDWLRTAKHKFWYKVDATTTTGPKKHSETVGLPAMEIEFNNGAWVIPWDEYGGHPPGHYESSGCAWCRFDYEFRHHPVASTSDFVMATWFCRQAIEEHNYVFMGRNMTQNLGNLSAR